MADAFVVCRQLGYERAHAVRRGAFYGKGSGLIWMDNVKCTGKEASLEECRGHPLGSHDCDHSEDARVVCAGTNNFTL
ncbi:Galectin-3-binding protein B [Holothuria leucospilota]|uniref:Galectin-3-binding protein B n=1 Tax=Holothuria leucospilota TaxID=206669 RepID=A0A9Q0YIW6_HOLLE|nr:Galectin-3-binding protein B [Holothuria leucospilota]